MAFISVFGASTALLDCSEKGYQFSCCRAQTSYQQPIRMKLLLWENCIIYQVEHFFHLSLKQLEMIHVKSRAGSEAGHWFWHTLALPVSLKLRKLQQAGTRVKSFQKSSTSNECRNLLFPQSYPWEKQLGGGFRKRLGAEAKAMCAQVPGVKAEGALVALGWACGDCSSRGF